MIATFDTRWDSLGDCTFDVWTAVLEAVDSPLADEARACYEAAKGFTRLCLGQLKAESEYGTQFDKIKPSQHNPLGLRNTGSFFGFRTFNTWAEALAEWRMRLTSDTYKNGVYVKNVTLKDHLDDYCPISDGNDHDVYLADINAALRLMTDMERAPMATPTYGIVPRPPITKAIVDKPQGHGWSNYGPRDLLLALVYHNVKGRASTTGNYFANPAEPHGYNALTDWGVCNAIDGAAYDGVILMWNDPDSIRSPWASGGSGTPHGDGPAFINLCHRLGYDINQASEAIEISRFDNFQAVSPKCLRSLINLSAYRADRKAKVAYNVWPKNNHGIQMTLTHDEMGKPECDAIDVIDDVIREVGLILKHYQTKGQPVPQPEIALPVPIGGVVEDKRYKDTMLYELQRPVAIVHSSVNAYQAASRKATVLRTYKRDEVFDCSYLFYAGGEFWYASTEGYRIPVDGCAPRFTVSGIDGSGGLTARLIKLLTKKR